LIALQLLVERVNGPIIGGGTALRAVQGAGVAISTLKNFFSHAPNLLILTVTKP
jgi:hypothetical protein